MLPDFERQAENERKAGGSEGIDAKLKPCVSKLQRLKAEQDEIEQSKQQMVQLQQTLEENQRNAELEIERLKEEKETEIKAVEQQMQALSSSCRS